VAQFWVKLLHLCGPVFSEIQQPWIKHRLDILLLSFWLDPASTEPNVPNIEIWYDKPNETDVDSSWTGLSAELNTCPQQAMDYSPYPKVLALMEYARPDVILTADGQPFLILELTQMNPSGHNLPQRFSCLVRAAELGVPAIYYYLEKARRSESDPNPRYVNIRVPLGQLRLTQLFHTPSLSMIWPTNSTTLQAEVGAHAHQPLAGIVDHIVKLARQGKVLHTSDPIVSQKVAQMRSLIATYYATTYSSNASYNDVVSAGKCVSDQLVGKRISPPESCQLLETTTFLKQEYKRLKGIGTIPSNKKTAQLLSRTHCLVYTGTANAKKDGPEHPYPGYLTLLDVLYARSATGMVNRDRTFNLAFRLPIDVQVFKDKAFDRQTGLNILMEFSDLIVLNDAVVVGGFLRNVSAGAVLIS
jgi:hypothetical protein